MRWIIPFCLAPGLGLAQTNGMSWDWQLSGEPDLSVDVEALDLDPYNVTAEQISALNQRGVFTICYVSVGTLEDWRDDIDDFPPEVVGREYEEWPGEAFLDLRQQSILLPIMQARFEYCAGLGFDAIEPDNMDVHYNDSGFDISPEDTVSYVTELARIAHDLGLQIGQKNAPELTPQLSQIMDFAITENCLTDGWCRDIAPYAATDRPIFAAEYAVQPHEIPRYCVWGFGFGLSLIFKDIDLTAQREACD